MAIRRHNWKGMRPFDRALEEAGIGDSRVDDLYCAFNQLHSAIAKMDLENRRLFKKKSLEMWLRIFGDVEGLSDVMDTGWGRHR